MAGVFRARGRLPREPAFDLDICKVSASATKLGAIQSQEGEREDNVSGIAPGSHPTNLGQEMSASAATGLRDATRDLSDVDYTMEALTRPVARPEVAETEMAELAVRRPPLAAVADSREPDVSGVPSADSRRPGDRNFTHVWKTHTDMQRCNTPSRENANRPKNLQGLEIESKETKKLVPCCVRKSWKKYGSKRMFVPFCVSSICIFCNYKMSLIVSLLIFFVLGLNCV